MPKKKGIAKNIDRESIAKHKKLGGKISITPKSSLKTRKDWNLLYTPGVGAVSNYAANSPKKAREVTIRKNTVAVVSNGSAVLGLGNLGALGALPVMEGKAVIFKELGNVDAFPIVLDTQDPDEIINIVEKIAPTFGGINLEDIKAPECFYIEDALKKKLDIPVMHDDQHGTAIVVLAGLLNALKVVKKKKEHVSVTVLGAGAAGKAIAELLFLGGFNDIVVVDRKGVLNNKRVDLNPHKKKLSKLPTKRKNISTLEEAIIGADVLVGVSGPSTVSKRMVETMADDAIVFSLSNPTPEIMPDVARKAGAKIVATGRSDFPNQINNALVFPGIFRGALDANVKEITDDMKLKAAHALARLVKKPTAGEIIPSVLDKRVTKAIAKTIK